MFSIGMVALPVLPPDLNTDDSLNKRIVFTDDVLPASLHEFGHFLCNGANQDLLKLKKTLKDLKDKCK
jgi:hypothetical protein